MTVTHLSECGKEKLKKLARHSRESGNPVGVNKMHFCLTGLLHFARNDGILDSRHCNKASAASEARQRGSRRGNPEIQTAGLLHFVRNDSKGAMNYGSINSNVPQMRFTQSLSLRDPAF